MRLQVAETDEPWISRLYEKDFNFVWYNLSFFTDTTVAFLKRIIVLYLRKKEILTV